MHARPLTTDQYSIGFSIAHDFLSAPGYWPTLFSTYKEYGRNPDALLSVSISLWDEPVTDEVLNNLPMPDYDDTGFQPRKSLEKDLKRKILGRHPVVTVLGDGGDGKTALTLQTLYGLLQTNDHDFDAFVWVSAKSNRLTINEVSRIEGAITSSLGLFEEVARTFEAGDDPPIERVRRLLEHNKVLLVIDNLETVLDETLIDFASDVPGESKIIFTSRVPLGGDLSVKVTPFSTAESLTYLRRLIEAYDIETLRRLSEPTLIRHLNRLGNKPLLIKWFAIGVSTGLDPAKITANPEIALRFCMENVFERLCDSSRNVISIMTVIPQSISATILHHISFMPHANIEEGLSELMRFGLIEKADSSEYERLYRLKPFARSYISRVLKLTSNDADGIVARFRGISNAFEEERGAASRNRYDPRSFVVRTQSEAIAARRLRHAVSLAFKFKFDESHEIVNQLKISAPDYFEVYRVSAFIHYRQGDLPGAMAAYEAAFDVAGTQPQPQLHFFYGGFLMRSFGDHASARDQFKAALDLDPNETSVLREASRANLFLYDFPRAQEHISAAWNAGFKTFHDEVIVNDLQCQLFIRHADHLLTTGDPRGALEAMMRLHDFLDNIKPEVIDDLMIDHLHQSIKTIDSLRTLPMINDGQILDQLRLKIFGLTNHSTIETKTDKNQNIIHNRSGTLKEKGRTDKFGFLKDTFGIETYVNRTMVSQTLWSDMCEGRLVRFDIHSDGSGRTWAEGVALI